MAVVGSTTPLPRTSAKSRTRRSSRFATRGVPRERPAISVAPIGLELHVEQLGRAGQDRGQLIGVVEVEVRGEPEPVAKRARQQARSSRRTDEGEGRQVERDRGRARPFADDDVDPEVLHREVEHLFGWTSHAMDLVEEQHLALGQRRQHRGEVARVLNRRTTGDAQRLTDLGSDDHRQRGLAEPGWSREQHVVGRCAARVRRRQHQVQAARGRASCPTNSDEQLRSQRRFDGVVVALQVRVDERVAVLVATAVQSRRSPGRPRVCAHGLQRGLRAGRRRPRRRPLRRAPQRRSPSAESASRAVHPSPTSAACTCGRQVPPAADGRSAA